MAETIVGGAYQRPDGAWYDAGGLPLDRAAVAAAEAMHAERATQRRQAEAARAAQELAADPATRAALRALGAVAPEPKAEALALSPKSKGGA